MVPQEGHELSDREVRDLAVQLAHENELLHLRVLEITDLAEEAVAHQVAAEREREATNQELQKLLQTPTMRFLRMLHKPYAKLRRLFRADR